MTEEIETIQDGREERQERGLLPLPFLTARGSRGVKAFLGLLQHQVPADPAGRGISSHLFFLLFFP